MSDSVPRICPRELYHYQLLEYMRRSLWILAFGWPLLLACYVLTEDRLSLIGCAALMFTCGVYVISSYSFLLVNNVQVLRTFKMFSKNIHPMLEKRNVSHSAQS